MTKETRVSYIGTSTAWPLPVRSRANNPASRAETTPLELVLSATMVGRNRGWPATTVCSAARPEPAWMISSYAAFGPIGPAAR